MGTQRRFAKPHDVIEFPDAPQRTELEIDERSGPESLKEVAEIPKQRDDGRHRTEEVTKEEGGRGGGSVLDELVKKKVG
ncbi:MAG: hypothetical protein SWQ30_06145 [Thermodesulfobacteriota bacterium]|nr:hypothetical protein [Thermodesulfobacteriota bacterium]